MSKLRIFTTSAFTLALVLGLWTFAQVNFSDTSSSFADGDVLQASDLNQLFNDINTNFNDAETQINQNESAIGDLQSDKADVAGDTFTGPVEVTSDAGSNSGSVDATFYANNPASAGSAGLFESNNDDDRYGAVTVKQGGAGPALSLKSTGGGPLVAGANSGVVTLSVEADGSILIGDMGSGSDPPTLHLDATEGTIENDVGSGLPVAFGTVESDGSYLSGTTNWSASRNDSFPRYEISIDGENYGYADYTTVVTPISGAMGVQTGSGNNDLFVYLNDDAGNDVQGRFAFVTYAHP